MSPARTRSRPRSGTPLTLADAWALRAPERQLLLLALLSVGIGFLMVLGSAWGVGRPIRPADILPLLSYALALLTLHAALVLACFRGDQLLLASAACLSGVGLVARYRMNGLDAGADWALDQLILPAALLLMLLTCLGLMRGRYPRLAAGHWGWAGLSLLLLLALLAFGRSFRGGVYAAGLITPTELLKVTVVLFLASHLQRHAKALGRWSGPLPLPPFRALLPLGGFWLLLSALLLLQRDLGMFVILSLTLLIMLVSATSRIGYLVYGALAATGLGYLVLTLFSHGQRRILAWQAPFQDPTGGSWQILQGLSGMYSGGLWGEGFGQGNPEYTPIAESDFIYAVIGEELGLVGSALVVLLFLVLFARGLVIADRTRDGFGRLVCIGLVSVLAIQTFLNIGGVTKLIPLTGLTLPFISHGGSSLLTAFLSVGLILAVSDGGAAPASRGRQPPQGRAQARKRKAKVARAPDPAGSGPASALSPGPTTGTPK